MDTTKRKQTKLERRRKAIERQRDRMKLNKTAASAKYRLALALPSLQSPEEAATQLDHHCQYCGALLVPRIETFAPFGEPRQYFIWPDLHGCPEEAEALKTQLIERELSQAQIQEQLRQKQLTRAGLVGWLAEADFQQFGPRDDWPEAMDCKQRVMAYYEALANDAFEVVRHPIFRPHKKNWLIMHGHFGNGKTLLAASMVRWFAPGNSTYFRVWPDYERRIRATYGKDEDGNSRPAETEAEIIEELQKGAFVVIDDLDKRKATDFTRGVLYSVLNYRYNAELPTVLTFNYGPGDADLKAPGRLALEEFLGPAVLDRIIGSAFDVIEFNGPSYRSGVTLRP